MKPLTDELAQSVDKWAPRFWRMVDKDGPAHRYTPSLGPCWMWKGSSRNQYGHGQFALAPGHTYIAHRLAWWFAGGGWLSSDVVLRHTCDTPGCVNPDHLVPGTQADNMRDMVERRRHWKHGVTHCPKGHEYAGDNLYVYPDGRRDCRVCATASKVAYKQRRRAESIAAGTYRPPRLPADVAAAIVADRAAGASYSELAHKFEISTATAWKAVRRAGLT